MNLAEGLSIFAAVVQDKGFTAAAKRLHCKKQSVSERIRQLEEHIGATLIRRTTRSIRLTAAGEELYAASVRLAAELATAEDLVDRIRVAPGGLLRVAAPMSFGTRHLAPVVVEFMQSFPKVTVQLDLDDEIVDLVKGDYHLAVRIGVLSRSGLKRRPIAPVRRVICASPEYFQNHPKPKVPRDLLEHNCILYSNARTPAEWKFKGDCTVRVRGNLSVNNGEVRRKAALAGLGVVNMPTFIVAEDVRAGTLHAVLTEYMENDQSIYAVYQPGRSGKPSTTARAFIDLLVRSFKDPPWDRDAKAEPRQPKASAGTPEAPMRKPLRRTGGPAVTSTR